MIGSWQIVKGAFITIRSSLRFAEFRERGNRMLYMVGFLAASAETTIAGSDLTALDVSA